jgi:glycosyltransferase involved in cell wall biosynthesis
MQFAMRLLIVTHRPPWPLDNGNALRVYHLVEGLAARHRDTLVHPGDLPGGEAERHRLTIRCERIVQAPSNFPWDTTSRLQDLGQLLSPCPRMIQLWRSADFRATLTQLRRECVFDAVWAERSYIAESARSAGFRRIVVDLDDLETTALRRRLRHEPIRRSTLLEYLEFAKVVSYERLLPARFWRLAVCKEEDRAFFGRQRSRVFVVPNGAELTPVTPPERERPGTVLFVGQLGYRPNVDAVNFFRTAVLPVLERLCSDPVRFMVVGQRGDPAIPKLHDGHRILVATSVPDLTPYYAEAAVVVAPIRLGSGTRVKVLEALARGKAVVSTSIGAEGLDLRPGIDLEIADDPEQFARHCARLLSAPEERRRLGANGQERVAARYSWERTAEAADHALAC